MRCEPKVQIHVSQAPNLIKLFVKTLARDPKHLAFAGSSFGMRVIVGLEARRKHSLNLEPMQKDGIAGGSGVRKRGLSWGLLF